jgi:hypothetical protein
MGQLGHGDPIDVAETVTPTRGSAVELLRAAQRALTGEMADELAFAASRSPIVDWIIFLDCVRGNKADCTWAHATSSTPRASVLA